MTHRLLVGGELVLYGDVGDMWGDGSGFTGREVIEALAEHGKAPIAVRLNSGGGYAREGVAIYNALKVHGEVTIYVDAMAASAASVIAMAGSKIVMRDGALMMIHDPSGVTVGTAKDHQETASSLDKLGGIIAGIYSDRTGIDAAEIRTMMLAETWLDADEAVEIGFATEREDTKAVATAPFDFTLYSKTPHSLLQTAQRALSVLPVAPATSSKEPLMAKVETGATPEVTVVEPIAVVNHADEIFARCEVAKLTMAETAVVMKAAAGDLDKAKDAIINSLAARDTDQAIRPVATVTADARDRFKEGVTKSLMLKAGHEGGGQRILLDDPSRSRPRKPGARQRQDGVQRPYGHDRRCVHHAAFDFGLRGSASERRQ
jgi:ATP-dependent protease ClpP protease subunit